MRLTIETSRELRQSVVEGLLAFEDARMALSELSCISMEGVAGSCQGSDLLRLGLQLALHVVRVGSHRGREARQPGQLWGAQGVGRLKGLVMFLHGACKQATTAGFR